MYYMYFKRRGVKPTGYVPIVLKESVTLEVFKDLLKL